MKKSIIVGMLFLLAVIAVQALADGPGSVRYNHPALGFTICYPQSWQILSQDKDYQNMQDVKLSKEKFTQLIQKGSAAPFFAIMKYAEPYPDLNPTLQVNTRPYGGLAGKPLNEIMQLTLIQLEKILKNYQITVYPKKARIGNANGWYAQFFYTMIAPDGKEFPGCSEVWLVDKGTFFYMIGASTRQDETTGTRGEVADILKTVVFK